MCARRGLSLRDAAELVGCSHQQIKKLVDGFSNPYLCNARRLAEVFGVTVDDLFPPAIAASKGKAA